MNPFLAKLWSVTLGRAIYRVFGQRVEVLGTQLAQAAAAQQSELHQVTAQLSELALITERLRALDATTLELSELVLAIQQRLETREGHSDRVAEEQARIAAQMETVDRRQSELAERYGELDRHVRLIVAARWEEAAVNRRLADIEDRLAGPELSADPAPAPDQP